MHGLWKQCLNSVFPDLHGRGHLSAQCTTQIWVITTYQQLFHSDIVFTALYRILPKVLRLMPLCIEHNLLSNYTTHGTVKHFTNV